MAKIRVAILGTVGKSVLIDTDLGTRVAALEGAVAALGAVGTVKQHRALGGLTQGDDHPQYTMWQAPETINAKWNFAAEPDVEGVPLTEFIQDVVGMELVENTNSITWTYDDTAGELEANVVPEFVEDTVGAMLTDTSSVDLVYTDASGQISANVICANPSGLIGMAAVNGSAVTPLRSDGRHAIDPAIAPTWTATHTFNNTPVVPNDSWVYAKIQNVSATSRVLGRISSGAGDIEELTGANLATILGSAIPSGANPTASVGLSAVNGSASTFMRSDGAPAISPNIAPTWLGPHTFSPTTGRTTFNASTGDFAFGCVGDPTAGQSFGFFCQAGTNASDRSFNVFSAAAGFRNYMVIRGDGLVSLGNTTDNPNVEFLGTGTAIHGGRVRLKGYTVATLPAGTVGDTAYVTDALAPTFLAVLVGGGAITTMAFYNGANWVAQ